ncbi:hypothetical protein B0T14DRAFT_505313 [Immersiella caudata]|uniref:Uncharacterized protein n=1 Tax=Immersiella caudata TaxID=314043 RepID=A0AA40CBQ5_9PEZI|nr:hypothetical protein B0T14DRAFT_505313 [Immersiella caudata]
MPHRNAIALWARSQLKASANDSFDFLIQQLLVVYVEQRALDHANSLEPNTGDAFLKSQNEWLDKLLMMRCMWNVWSCETFCVLDSRGQPLTGSTKAVQDYLHQFAGLEISWLEKVVLRELDKLQTGIKGDQPLLTSAYHIGVWIAMWQLIMMYRQPAPLWFQRAQFRETTEELFNKVVVLYSALFRTTKALNHLIGAGSRVFGGKPIVAEAFEKAWASHTKFYNSFRYQFSGDELIQGLVIKKESEVLRRKRGRK